MSNFTTGGKGVKLCMKQKPRKNGPAASAAHPPVAAEGGLLNSRTLFVFRVSKRTSTTENQRFALEGIIRNMPAKPVTRSIIATSWRKPIPAMKELLAEVRAGKWDEVHFWRVDRTGRSHQYDVDLWKTCQRFSTVLIYHEEGLRSDRQDDEVKFYRLSVEAQAERESTSRRVKVSFDRKRAEARAAGGDWWTGGCKPGRLWLKTRQAIPVVLDLLRLGRARYKIAKQIGLTWRTVDGIAKTPIQQLRDQSGDQSLQDWRQDGPVLTREKPKRAR